MSPVLWSPKARRQLAQIIDFIGERNPDAALKLLSEIEQHVAALPKVPLLYRVGRIAGTREMVVRANYLVIYRVTRNAIEIIGVLHTRKQYPGRGAPD